MAQGYILKVVSAYRQGIWLFDMFSIFSVAMAFASWLIAFSNVALALSTAVFNIFAAYLNWWPRYRRLPGAVLLSFQMAIYFSLPLVWVGLTQSSYDFTSYFVAPGSNEQYSESLPLAIGYLVIAMLSLIVGMVFGNKLEKTSSATIELPIRHSFESGSLILLVMVVAWISFRDVMEVLTSLSERFEADQAGKEQNLIAFLLNDAAFLLLFPLLFFSIFIGANRLDTFFAKTFYLFVSLIFIFIYTAGTSKAGVLLVFLPLYIYPIAISYSSAQNVYWPTWQTFFILSTLATILFVYSSFSRQLLSIGGVLSFGLVLDALTDSGNYSSNIVVSIFAPILDRLSSTINNYVVIFAHYSENYDPIFAIKFAWYILKSFLNLMLPGTPFLDAYLPSSSMLPQVLEKAELVGLGDGSTFWVSANTQSYSIIGVLLILVGPVIALPVLMAGGFIFSNIYGRIANPIYRALAILGFQLIFFSYGVEVAMQTIVHFFVATSFMVLFLYTSHRIIKILRSSAHVKRKSLGKKSAL